MTMSTVRKYDVKQENKRNMLCNCGGVHLVQQLPIILQTAFKKEKHLQNTWDHLFRGILFKLHTTATYYELE